MPETTPPTYQPGGPVSPPAEDTTDLDAEVTSTLREAADISDGMFFSAERATDVLHVLDALRQRAEDAEAERDGYAAAIRTAREALIHADPLCRYHAATPPAHSAWHGGCDSCKQPTRVRAALAAIDAAQRATLDTTQDGGDA